MLMSTHIDDQWQFQYHHLSFLIWLIHSAVCNVVLCQLSMSLGNSWVPLTRLRKLTDRHLKQILLMALEGSKNIDLGKL